jgi:hypothetical protein
MGDLTLVALIAALPPTLMAMATFQQRRRIVKTVDQVHTLTNSNLSRVLTDLKLANDRIEKLEKLISAKTGEA